MVKVEKIMAKYGVTWEQVQAWASVNPQWAKWLSNKRLMVRQYLLATRSLDVLTELEMGTKLEPTAKIGQLVLKTYATVRGVVVSKLKENTWMGCPTCNKKSVDGAVCEKHGEEPVARFWRTYVLADEDDEVVLSVPPNLQELALLDKEVLVYGTLNDQLELQAQKIQIPEAEGTATIATAVPAAPAQPQVAYVPPAAPSVQPMAAATTPVGGVDAAEVKQFLEILKVFKALDLTQATGWHTGNHIKTPMADLIAAANCVLDGNVIKPKA